MGDPSSARLPESSSPKIRWPKYSLVLSVFLWLLVWEAIVCFVPVQPRLVIRTSEDLENEGSLYLTGFSPDSTTLVTAVEPDPNERGQIYRLWDLETGQDLGVIGSKERTILPNVVYCSQRDLTREMDFPMKPFLDTFYTLYDLIGRRETASIQIEREEGLDT